MNEPLSQTFKEALSSGLLSHVAFWLCARMLHDTTTKDTTIYIHSTVNTSNPVSSKVLI
jgi:hypothetical protein